MPLQNKGKQCPISPGQQNAQKRIRKDYRQTLRWYFFFFLILLPFPPDPLGVGSASNRTLFLAGSFKTGCPA